MTETNFKDLPIPTYFTWENVHYQKLSKGKVRRFGKDTEEVIKANPVSNY